MKQVYFLLGLCLLLSSCAKDDFDLYLDFAKQIESSTEVIKKDTKKHYACIKKSFEEYPKRVEPWYKKSVLVKENTDKFIDRIDSLLQSYANWEGSDSIGYKGHLIERVLLKRKDINLLKQEFEKLKLVLLAVIGDKKKNEGLFNGFNNILSINAWYDLGVFSTKNVRNIELIAILMAIKQKIKIAECGIVEYLYHYSASCDSYHYHLKSFVLPKSKTILQGETFEADILLSPYDTTAFFYYFFEGKKYQETNGNIKYRHKVIDKTGLVKKDGYFMLKKPRNGKVLNVPFNVQYEVMEK